MNSLGRKAVSATGKKGGRGSGATETKRSKIHRCIHAVIQPFQSTACGGGAIEKNHEPVGYPSSGPKGEFIVWEIPLHVRKKFAIGKAGPPPLWFGSVW